MLILLAPLFTTNPRFVVQWGELGLATPTECRQVAWVQTPAHQIELIMGRWDLDCWNQMWVWLKSWLVGELYFLSNYRCVECQMLKTSPPFKNCAQKRNNKGKLLAVSICLAVCLFVCLVCGRRPISIFGHDRWTSSSPGLCSIPSRLGEENIAALANTPNFSLGDDGVNFNDFFPELGTPKLWGWVIQFHSRLCRVFSD